MGNPPIAIQASYQEMYSKLTRPRYLHFRA